MESTSSCHSAHQQVQDINLVSAFLANSQLTSLTPPIEVVTTQSATLAPRKISPSTIIIAPSAILHQAHTLFSFLQVTSRSHTVSSSVTTFVLTGGYGHSTPHLYAAISRHPVYSRLASLLEDPAKGLEGLSEARLFYLIFVHFYDGQDVARRWNQGQGLKVLVEETSTNCGANATRSKELLDQEGINLGSQLSAGYAIAAIEARGGAHVPEILPEDVVIVQDPTMSLRSKASFEKVYEDVIRNGRLRFWTWPVFTPTVIVSGDGLIVWDAKPMANINVSGLWEMRRFYGLILGEIGRLRDDENGYGPKGKGFIAHVDIPRAVESAWQRLHVSLEQQR